MATLLEIRQFRETGRLIREARESKQISLMDLARLTGFTTAQIASLENGNHYAFQGHHVEFSKLANRCMDHLHINPESNVKQLAELQKQRPISKPVIPRFLRKDI